MSTIQFLDPKTPIVSNISGGLLTTADEVAQELSDQICAAVEWVGCMGTMVNQGIATFVEVGPGRTLSGIARRFSENLSFVSAEDANPADLAPLLNQGEAQQPA
jgi:[acyl-carrier-protein] S-malonyltransferase